MAVSVSRLAPNSADVGNDNRNLPTLLILRRRYNLFDNMLIKVHNGSVLTWMLD